MNIHINKNTRLQSWEGKTIFNEYPVHIRPGNFTVTLLFHDREAINNLREILTKTLFEIEPGEFESFLDEPLDPVKNKRF